MKRLTAHGAILQLGQKIVELRSSRNLTQEQLGEFVGLTARELRRIEHGEVDVTMGMLVRFVNALDTDLHTLLEAPVRPIVQKPGRPRRRA